MKLPPKFALVLLPVTLIHLAAITLLGIVTRIEESKRGVVLKGSFVSTDRELPGYLPADPVVGESDGVSSSLFPEDQLPLSAHSPARVFSGSDPDLITPEVVKSEAATIFPFEEAATKLEKADPPAKIEAPRQEAEVKAKQRPSTESAPRIRGFRPINAKKTS